MHAERNLFSPEQLREFFPIKPGDIFDTHKLQMGVDELRKAYGEKGYINFTTIPTFDIDETNDCISLIVELDEGKQFRIDRVQVLGTDPQTAQALINRSGLTSGSVFVFSRLEDVKLSEPDISEALDEKRGTVDLTIDLRDCHLR